MKNTIKRATLLRKIKEGRCEIAFGDAYRDMHVEVIMPSGKTKHVYIED